LLCYRKICVYAVAGEQVSQHGSHSTTHS
jgi:hypothetical protein